MRFHELAGSIDGAKAIWQLPHSSRTTGSVTGA